MFSDLTVQQTGNTFWNSMSGYNSQSQSLTNSIAATVDATNGLYFTSGDTQTINGVVVTAQRALSAQMWFKGTFSNNQNVLAIAKTGAIKTVYLKRSANNLVLETTHSGLSYTFSAANTALDGTGWMFIGISAGWMARNNDFMI